MKVTKKVDFCYGHQLPKHSGKCKNLHGHNSVLEVTAEGPVDQVTSMVIDFIDLKAAIKEVTERYDHKMLIGPDNSAKLVALMEEEGWPYVVLDGQPTAEMIASAIQYELSYLLKPLKISVRMHETENSWVEL